MKFKNLSALRVFHTAIRRFGFRLVRGDAAGTWISTRNIGGEGYRVGELRPVVLFELEAYPEPKALSRADLLFLLERLKTGTAVARHIQASQAFVSEKIRDARKWSPKQKKFIKNRLSGRK